MAFIALGVIGLGRASLGVVAFRLIVLSLGRCSVLRTVGLRRSLGGGGGSHRRTPARRGKGGDREGQKSDETRA
jgi:hypothetical protein